MAGKKEFNKEAMYWKIMPSSAPKNTDDDSCEASVELAPRRDVATTGTPAARNLMEDIIRERLPGAIQAMGGCTCGRCREDSLAVALNMLPSAYLVIGPDLVEDKIGQLRKRYGVKITAAVVKAVQIVKSQPRHFSD